MYDVMRFWMKRGVAGFRLDAVPSLFEDAQLRDEPVAKPGKSSYGDPILTRQYTDNLPECNDVLREMRKVTDEFADGVLVGEAYLANVEDLAKMYGANGDELHLPMDTHVRIRRAFRRGLPAQAAARPRRGSTAAPRCWSSTITTTRGL